MISPTLKTNKQTRKPKKKTSLNSTALCSYHLNFLFPLRSNVFKRESSTYCLHFLPPSPPFFLLSSLPHRQSVGHRQHDLSRLPNPMIISQNSSYSTFQQDLTQMFGHSFLNYFLHLASQILLSPGSSQTSLAILSWSPFFPHLRNL